MIYETNTIDNTNVTKPNNCTQEQLLTCVHFVKLERRIQMIEKPNQIDNNNVTKPNSCTQEHVLIVNK